MAANVVAAAFALSMLSAIADWVAVARSMRRIEYILKPATLALLLVAGLLLRALPHDAWATPFFLFALAASLAGDICLMWPGDRLFLPGLVAFLAAHIGYVLGLKPFAAAVGSLAALSSDCRHRRLVRAFGRARLARPRPDPAACPGQPVQPGYWRNSVFCLGDSAASGVVRLTPAHGDSGRKPILCLGCDAGVGSLCDAITVRRLASHGHLSSGPNCVNCITGGGGMISASYSESLPSLTTARLVLRPFVDADFDALRAIESDPEILRFRSRPVISPAMTRERLHEYVTARHDPARTRFPFAITLRVDGALIGDCGLTLLADEIGGAFLWYSVNQQYWRNGYATEAAAIVLNFGLANLRLSHIEARCHQDNRASMRVLEKIGMERVPPGQSAPADHVEFSIRRLTPHASEKEENA